MLKRSLIRELLDSVSEYGIVKVLGARQVGKTSLIRSCFTDKPYYSLEDPLTRMQIERDPLGFRHKLQQEAGAILDEVQCLPVVEEWVKEIANQHPQPGQFILLSSIVPLNQDTSTFDGGNSPLEKRLFLWSLAYEEYEATPNLVQALWQGSMPLLQQHDGSISRDGFYADYLQTYLERDIRALVNLKDIRRFQRFLLLMAERIGQVANHSTVAKAIGVSSTTIQHWVKALQASFLLIELPAFSSNIHKRVVKSSKYYFSDTGLAAFLLGFQSAEALWQSSWRQPFYENLMILELLKTYWHQGINPSLAFYRDSQGHEVELLIQHPQGILPVAIRLADSFQTEFVAGIEQFRKASKDWVPDAVVLYNGEANYTINNTRILNLWQTNSPDSSAT